MKNNNPAKKKKFNAKSTRHWHRYMGFIASVFALVLAVTGVMLNHTEYLKLDSKFVQFDSLLNLYGIRAPDRPTGTNTNGRWISQVDNHLYLSGRQIIETTDRLVGAVTMDSFVVVALKESIVVLSNSGELVESLGQESGVPENILDVGISTIGQPILRTSTGLFQADDELLSWRPIDDIDVKWAEQAPVPDDVYEKIKGAYMGSGLPLERVVLDLHSGRLFGLMGVYVWDFIAVVIVALSISGLVMYFFPAEVRGGKGENGGNGERGKG